MFNDVNRATLLGNVTNDPDLRFTNSGSAVLSFGLATNHSYKVGDDWKEEVTFHNIVLWKNAESVAKRIRKGSKVYIEGRIQNRSWEGTDGQKKYKTEIVAESITLLARYNEGPMGADGQSKSSNDSTPKPQPENKTVDEDIIDPDDLPF